MSIGTADSVRHEPTGETWLVAYVQGDRLAWCGWPEGTALVADCTLTRKANEEERYRLLRQMAHMNDERDPRCRYARRALADGPPHRHAFVLGRCWCGEHDAQGDPT